MISESVAIIGELLSRGSNVGSGYVLNQAEAAPLAAVLEVKVRYSVISFYPHPRKANSHPIHIFRFHPGGNSTDIVRRQQHRFHSYDCIRHGRGSTLPRRPQHAILASSHACQPWFWRSSVISRRSIAPRRREIQQFAEWREFPALRESTERQCIIADGRHGAEHASGSRCGVGDLAGRVLGHIASHHLSMRHRQRSRQIESEPQLADSTL